MNPELLIIALVCALFIAGAVLIILISLSGSISQHSGSELWRVYGFEFLIISVVLLPAFMGKGYFLVMLLLLSLRAHREINNVLKKNAGTLISISYLSGALFCILIVTNLLSTWLAQTILLIAAVTTSILTFRYDKNWHRTIWLLFLLNLSITCLLTIASLDNGFILVFFLYLLTESNDSFAYLTGKLIGKYLLFPDISPNKTLEGMLGGIFISIIFGLLFNNYMIHMPWVLALGVIATLITSTIFGDLLFSIYKRGLGIKDFSPLIKYHGGALDIYDSFLVSSIIYYFLLQLLN